mgnify:CR=1 FL=1
MEVSASFWIGFIILVVILLSLDMFVFNKKGTVIDVKKALWLSLFWISLALVFNAGVYVVFGKESTKTPTCKGRGIDTEKKTLSSSGRRRLRIKAVSWR